jgi:hypothetical protein
MMRRILTTACVVLSLAIVSPTIDAHAADLTLYEVTENMKFKTLEKEKRSGVRRQATSALTGTAAPGTPLCPLPVTCVVNATGSDDIDVRTGLGTFKGKWSAVVHGDNDVDAPEFEIANGKFRGVMDFSPALLHYQPYGTVVGELKVGKDRYAFTGVFYLPFLWPGDPSRTPLYLGATGPVPVGPNEYSIGFPTVKFEITVGRKIISNREDD